MKVIKVFADTNIIVSSILYPLSTPYLALKKATQHPYNLYTSKYCFDELFKVFLKKFPNKINDLRTFFDYEICSITILDSSGIIYEEENLIRDEKDREILRCAIEAGIDFLLTGDNDFLESGISRPQPISPRDFLSDK